MITADGSDGLRTLLLTVMFARILADKERANNERLAAAFRRSTGVGRDDQRLFLGPKASRRLNPSSSGR